MTLTCPISEMITTIRNATKRKYSKVVFPYSNLKWNICIKLEHNNFLKECVHNKENRKIEAKIVYFGKKCNIYQIKTISKPSQHIHFNVSKIKKYCFGPGTYIISTSKGLFTQKEALKQNQGGKILFSINN